MKSQSKKFNYLYEVFFYENPPWYRFWDKSNVLFKFSIEIVRLEGMDHLIDYSIEFKVIKNTTHSSIIKNSKFQKEILELLNDLKRSLIHQGLADKKMTTISFPY